MAFVSSSRKELGEPVALRRAGRGAGGVPALVLGVALGCLAGCSSTATTDIPDRDGSGQDHPDGEGAGPGSDLGSADPSDVTPLPDATHPWDVAIPRDVEPARDAGGCEWPDSAPADLSTVEDGLPPGTAEQLERFCDTMCLCTGERRDSEGRAICWFDWAGCPGEEWSVSRSRCPVSTRDWLHSLSFALPLRCRALGLQDRDQVGGPGLQDRRGCGRM